MCSSTGRLMTMTGPAPSTYQPSMFDLDVAPGLGPLAGRVERIELSAGAWVDRLPGWLSGSDALLEQLLSAVPWRAERRQMYDREVDVPRLLCWYADDDELPHPVLADAKSALSRYYRPELREPFRTAGLCLYRDGRDSVAWHGDTIGRGSHSDTMVAILSVGSDRPLLLRPRASAVADSRAGSADGDRPAAGTEHDAPLRIPVGHGDLVVMGGSCQRTWEHAIPKTSKVVGPRVSIQFRPRGVA
jgi:alkylated DNA repair dioxygenase AlkB